MVKTVLCRRLKADPIALASVANGQWVPRQGRLIRPCPPPIHGARPMPVLEAPRDFWATWGIPCKYPLDGATDSAIMPTQVARSGAKWGEKVIPPTR
jgi:hypothetical protein